MPGYSMGGKTGTAQKGRREDKKYVVSFIGFAPVEDPKVLVYVVIDEANVAEDDQSSALATALAKKIFGELLPYMNIFKDEQEVTADDGTVQGEVTQAEESQEDASPETSEAVPEDVPDAMPEGADGTMQQPEDMLDGMTPEEYP